MKEEKKTFIKGLLVGIVILLWGYTVVSGGMVLYRRHFDQEITVSQKIDLIYALLEQHFVGELDSAAIQDAMFAGMLYGVGDRYTSYMNAYEFSRFIEFARGTYYGIGAVVSRAEDGGVLIVSPYVGSPAYNAGILPGDRIILVDGADISNYDLGVAISYITGPAGTSVTLTIYREIDNTTFDVEIVRALIEIPTVFYEILENNIGYIRLTGFEEVTYDQFVQAYTSLLEDGIYGLILDLRNNPGGILNTVVRITDHLVPEGLIISIEGTGGNVTERHSDENHIEIPFVILINGNSASASEVLTGAAMDHGVARVVGQTSFGKGLVQDIFPLPDGSAVRMTVATYFTPNGTSIHGYGIQPHYEVIMEDALNARVHQLELEEDIQLQKALEVIDSLINE